MDKLMNLTTEQEAMIIDVRQEWLDLVFKSTEPLDEVAAKAGINRLYAFAELPAPMIITLNSPLGCQFAANMIGDILKNITEGKQLGDQVWNQVGIQVGIQVKAQVLDQVEARVLDQVEARVKDQVWDQVGYQVEDQVRDQVGDQVWAQTRYQVEAQARDQVWDQVGFQVRDQIWDQIRYQVEVQVGDPFRNQVRDQVEALIGNQKCYATAWCDLLYDADFGSFYSYFKKIGVVNHPHFDEYVHYLRSGVFYSIFLQGVAFVCGRPEYIKRDDSNRLHSADGPAIKWADGYANYCWHGVTIPAKLVDAPDEITKEDLIQEDNAEVRRCYMEALGTERFFELLDVEMVDMAALGEPGYISDYCLYRTREEDTVAGEYINFLQMECHSTGRKYVLCVPADITTAAYARAWTFGLTPDEYKPSVEA